MDALFEDLDGHIWELGYMDMDNLPEEMKNKKVKNLRK